MTYRGTDEQLMNALECIVARKATGNTDAAVCQAAADRLRALQTADKLAAEVERRMNDLGGYDGRFPVRQALDRYKKERGLE